MSRLIDADKFKQQIVAYVFTNNLVSEKAKVLCEIIDKQHTVYDVDKVVEQLENMKTDGIKLANFQNRLWK